MIVSKKYLLILVLIVFSAPAVHAQYFCKKEYKVMNKQKKVVKKIARTQAEEWLAKNSDSLKLPADLKLSRLKFLAETKEVNHWFAVDSLLCIKPNADQIAQAKKVLTDLDLVVYDIRATFSFADSHNPLIKSVLNFEYNFNGKLIRAVVRKKEKSPFSETPYRGRKKK